MEGYLTSEKCHNIVCFRYHYRCNRMFGPCPSCFHFPSAFLWLLISTDQYFFSSHRAKTQEVESLTNHLRNKESSTEQTISRFVESAFTLLLQSALAVHVFQLDKGRIVPLFIVLSPDVHWSLIGKPTLLIDRQKSS